MPLMRGPPAQLSQAYSALNDANNLYVRIYGVPCAEAIYNMACCLSLSSEAQRAVIAGTDVSPGLPPHWAPGTQVGQTLLEARAALSLDMLERAIDAGFNKEQMMRTDADLRAARELRPGRFNGALARIGTAPPPAAQGPAQAPSAPAPIQVSTAPIQAPCTASVVPIPGPAIAGLTAPVLTVPLASGVPKSAPAASPPGRFI